MKELLIIIGGIVVITAGMLIGAYYADKTQCLSSYSNYEPQFGVFTGCRVMWNGKLTPTDIVREIN